MRASLRRPRRLPPPCRRPAVPLPVLRNPSTPDAAAPRPRRRPPPPNPAPAPPNQPPANVLLATAGYDHTIRFWEAPSGMCYRTVQFLDSQVNCLKITPDKQFLAAAGNPLIRLYDIGSNNPNPVTVYDGHTSNVTAIGFHRDGKWLYSASEDGSIKVWDLRAAGCQRNYVCTSGSDRAPTPVNTVALHPNQAELVSGDQSGNLRVWDLTANRCVNELVPDGETPIRSISVAVDASLVVAANNSGHCFVWQPQSTREYQPLKRFRAHDAYVLKVQISPDCRYMATASSDHTVKLWLTENWALDKTLSGHQRWVWDCVFSEDSDYLVTASSDQSARLWDLEQGEVIRVYAGHHKSAVAVALNDSSIE